MSSGGNQISSDDEIAINKLEYLKELRDLTLDLNNIKTRLKQELDAVESEKKCLVAYRKEKEFLEQEKLAHVEELRLIHSDLNQMETVIKESDEEHSQHLSTAKSLLIECQQLKDHANKMRSGLGLDLINDLHEEEEKIRSELFKKHHLSEPTNRDYESNGRSMNKTLLTISTANSQPPSMIHGVFKPNLPSSVHQPRLGFSGQGGSSVHPGPSSGVPSLSMTDRQPPPAAFRQQPPPMKSCLSCHQQIHRNAPICPLCKAKSRSRNPKKPKRKTED
ncbi:zinc finger C4H2 domain-containing protein-like [Panonychus citri]|uniref:zinc finger C4H2 domain-containing protein-like n=1 Tax=Panonychus citri TaxID=50023 RepID=UPI002307D428|nr:zinc finger C4H2 domain-containing protein-like [Panonychus citri]